MPELTTAPRAIGLFDQTSPMVRATSKLDGRAPTPSHYTSCHPAVRRVAAISRDCDWIVSLDAYAQVSSYLDYLTFGYICVPALVHPRISSVDQAKYA